MSINELGACEWFVWDLRRSNLVDRGQLDQICVEFLKQQPGAEPPALAAYLVKQGILTQFQADRLLQGKTQQALVLGPYVLTDALGAGSMGTVYKAQSKTNQQWYAIKVLPRRSMWNVRIARRQVRAFEQIKHPAVVPFVDVGTAGGAHYLAWPFVEGEALDLKVTRMTKLTPSVAARYVCQAGEALDECHQAGLVHGMLKPSNLTIAKDGEIRILDFGIGSLLSETGGESLVDTMSTANSLTSGLDCAAPECIMEPNKRSPAGDQYSLGCVLYFCLTGRYPFPEGTAVEKMMAHQTKQPPPIHELAPDVPQGIIAVVEQLMQKSPEARFPSMAAAVEALAPFAESFSGMRAVARKQAMQAARPARLSRTAATIKTAGGPSARPSRVAKAAVTEPAPSSAPAPAAPAAAPAPAAVAAPPAPPVVPAAPAPVAAACPVPTLAALRLQTVSADDTMERFGPLGVFSGAMLAGVLTWFAWLMLHR